METKEYKLLDGRTIRAKYNRLGRCNISKENLEEFVKEFNASYRQAKILEKIKENYALMKADERKKGKWIGTCKIGFGEFAEYEVELIDGFVADNCHCSECGEELEKGERGIYCPNCGAEMESEQLLSYADQDTMKPAT